MAFNKDCTLRIKYKNYKGEISDREILPMDMKFGSNKYHTEKQWLLEAYDVNKKETRSFAMKDILQIYGN